MEMFAYGNIQYNFVEFESNFNPVPKLSENDVAHQIWCHVAMTICNHVI